MNRMPPEPLDTDTQIHALAAQLTGSTKDRTDWTWDEWRAASQDPVTAYFNWIEDTWGEQHEPAR